MEEEPNRNASSRYEYPSGGPQTTIDRPTYNEEQLQNGFRPVPTSTPKTILQRLKCARPTRADCTRFILAHIPFITVLANYKNNWKGKLIGDIAGGLTIGIMTIPQGLAYASLANVEPVTGLYTGIFPVVIYALLGTSQHVSMGVFAVVTILIGEAVSVQLPDGEITCTNVATNVTCTPTNPREVAVAVGLVVGIVQFAFFLFRLGFVARFMSDAMVSGFTTGAAFHVGASQLRHVFGLNIRYSSPFIVPKTIFGIFKNIPDTNAAAFLIAAVSISLLIIAKLLNAKFQHRLRFPIPGELIVVILGTGISYGGKFEENFNITVVNEVKRGIPPPHAPRADLVANAFLGSHSYVIAIVSFAITMSLAKLFAKKNRYKVDSNQELFAYGTSNIICSFFNCLVSSGSLSRTAVYASAGGKTILGSLFSAFLILIVVVAVAPLFAALPAAVLASVVLVGLRGLMVQFKDVKRLYKLSTVDMWVWLITWTATVAFAVDIGLAVGIGVSLLVIIYRTAWPHYAVLGRMSHTDLYRDVTRYYLCHEVEGIKIFRYEASLCFANAESFKAALIESLGIDLETGERTEKEGVSVSPDDSPTVTTTSSSVSVNLTPRKRKGSVHTVVIDCTVFTYLDSLSVGLLVELTKDLEKVGIQMLLAGCRWRIRQRLKQGLYLDEVGSSHLFVTIHDAVVFAQTGLCLIQAEGERSELKNISGSVFSRRSSRVGETSV